MDVDVFKQIEKSLSKAAEIQQCRKEWMFQGKWLRGGNIHYISPNKEKKVWETVERTTKKDEGSIDGVDIIALMKNSSQVEFIQLIAIYRPSVNHISIELPSGLINEGENIEKAALRELVEETGKQGVIESIGNVTHGDPWKSNESSVPCTVTIDTNNPSDENLTLDEDEYLETFQIPLKRLMSNLEELQKKYNVVIESKLYMLAKGIEFGQKM